MVAVQCGQELQDACADHQRRTRLPYTLHAIASVLHRASKDERAVEADHLLERGSLAELVRDGVVLHGAPRMVSQVSGRRRAPVELRAVPAKRGIRPRERQTNNQRAGPGKQKQMTDKLSQFAGEKYLNIETYRKSGAAVATPVWFAEDS